MNTEQASDSHRTQNKGMRKQGLECNSKNLARVTRSTNEVNCDLQQSSKKTQKEKQIDGFVHCLKTWVNIDLKTKLTRADIQHIRSFLHSRLSSKPLGDYPKEFKNFLAYNFSIFMKQELPSKSCLKKIQIGLKQRKNGKKNQLFPERVLKVLRNRISKREKRLRIFWNLMQCKSLAATVPQAMILSSLEKHSKTLDKVELTNPQYLEGFKQFIKPYIQEFKREFRNKTKLPSCSACFEAKRSDGGFKTVLKDNIISKSVNELPRTNDQEVRTEPVTLIIGGTAGCGKSTLVENIISYFKGNVYQLPKDQVAYSKSDFTEHWDGYNNQPITVIDDFLQKHVREAGDSKTLEEFMNLTSSVDYRVPMASLNDKGKKFNSRLILMTTNHTMHSLKHWNSKINFCEEAFVRRFFYYDLETQRLYNGRESLKERNSQSYQIRSSIDLCRFLHEQLKEKEIYANRHLNYAVSQYLGNNGKEHFFINYPKEDSSVLPKVMTHAIPEPLKVRVITKNEKNSFAMKPVQLALFRSLMKFDCFKPCYDPNYQRDLEKIHLFNQGIWVSGDYSAATDGLHFDLSQIAMEEISIALEEIGEFELASLTRREGGRHEIHYPKWTKIQPYVQTNGQLMGSLLSFPILCLANAFTVGYTQERNLTDLKNCLIHGDDLAMKCSEENFQKWKNFCGQIGLEFSVGKNYISKDWVSIDSQVYTFGDQNCLKLNTGKFSCFLLNTDIDSKVTEILKNRKDVTKKFLIRRFWQDIRKTPRSIDINTKFGGLDPKGHEPRKNLEKLVYTTKVFNKRPTRVSSGIWRIPEYLGQKNHLQPCAIIEEREKSQSKDDISNEDLTWKTIKKFARSKTFKVLDKCLPIEHSKLNQKTYFVSDVIGMKLKNEFEEFFKGVNESFQGLTFRGMNSQNFRSYTDKGRLRSRFNGYLPIEIKKELGC